MDITFKAILAETARPLVHVESGGRDGRYTFPKLGLTAVSIDQGQISSRIPWMIHGTEAVISGDIIKHIVTFELTVLGLEGCSHGNYVIRNRSNQILAEALVEKWVAEKSKVYIIGRRREDVIKLFELIRDGETAPESAGGRRGLIRDLRERLSEGRELADRLNRELGIQLDSNLKLVGENAKLETQLTELKAVKKFTPWQFFWRAFFGTNDPQVA